MPAYLEVAMPILEAITAGTEALSLTAKLVELIKDSKRSGSPPALLELIIQIQGEAVHISRQFGARAREMMESLSRLGVDLDKSIPQLLGELDGWLDWRTRSKLNGAAGEFHALYQRLTQFLDDVTGVMICTGSVGNASNAYVEGLETKQRLDGLMLSNPPVRRILEEIIEISDRLFAQLQGGMGAGVKREAGREVEVRKGP
jgi:hypothetical protein